MVICVVPASGCAALADEGPREGDPACPKGIPLELCDVGAPPENDEGTAPDDGDGAPGNKGLPDTGGPET